MNNQKKAHNPAQVHNLDLNEIKTRFKQEWHQFKVFADDAYASNWETAYCSAALKELFFAFYGGVFTTSATYQGAREFPKPERKTFLKNYERRIDDLADYLEAKVGWPVSEPEPRNEDVPNLTSNDEAERNCIVKELADAIREITGVEQNLTIGPNGISMLLILPKINGVVDPVMKAKVDVLVKEATDKLKKFGVIKRETLFESINNALNKAAEKYANPELSAFFKSLDQLRDQVRAGGMVKGDNKNAQI